MNWIIFYKWILIAVYTFLVMLYFCYFIFEARKLQRLLTYALFITILMHLHYLFSLTQVLGHVPFSNVFEVITSYVFLFVLIYFLIELRIHEKSLGIIIVIIAWILQIISNIFIDISKGPAEILTELTFFEWHVLAMLLAYSAFAISFIASLMYILLSREIQRKKLGFFFSRLPSLDLMDRLSNIAITIGANFITIGILLGILMASKVWNSNWQLDPKLISVFITWAIYVAFIYLRNIKDWQGKRASILSISGFIWILISFLLFSTVFSKIHLFI